MPVEAISCPKCGSPDATEFKPGSYVCGHCEAVFKHVDAGRSSIGCGIDGCGVAAIGRCETCGTAFCGTHQARFRDGFGLSQPYVDLSTSCQRKAHDAELESERALGEAEYHERYAEYLEKLAAYERLREAVIARLLAIDDPIARLAATFGYVLEKEHLPFPSPQIIHAGPQADPVCEIDGTILIAVLPELGVARELYPEVTTEIVIPGGAGASVNGGPEVPPLPWDSAAIAKWWAAQAAKRGLKPDREFGSARLGRYRKGWEFTAVGQEMRQDRWSSDLSSRSQSF